MGSPGEPDAGQPDPSSVHRHKMEKAPPSDASEGLRDGGQGSRKGVEPEPEPRGRVGEPLGPRQTRLVNE